MRLVDQDKSVRIRPMKVLALGISRTGSSSLCLALEKLGYKTFHMTECLKQPKRYFPLCIEAMDAKFAHNEPAWGVKEFDKLLGDYDAASDLPVALFNEELLSAYPDAKVILTLRDSSSWVASMQKTIYFVHSWSSWSMLTPFDTLIRLWHSCDGRNWDYFLGHRYPGRRDYMSAEYAELAKKKFDEHYEHIRAVVPKDKLLEHRSTEGWGPLCEFLGHEVPKEEYPRVWDADELLRMAKKVWWIALMKMLVCTAGPAGVAIWIGSHWHKT